MHECMLERSSVTHLGVSFGQAISTPWATSRDWKACRRSGVFRTARGESLRLLAERDESPGRLADGPLHGMKPVAAIGDVRGSEVLAGRQQVLDPAGNQGAQRDLERQRADVDVVDSAGAGMQVDPVASPRRRCRGTARP